MRWGPVLVWACAILVMTSWPGNPKTLEPALPELDKLAHFSVYCVLAVLTWRALTAPRTRSALISAFAAIAVFGALDELHQLYVPFRDASVFDWSADLLGALIGLRIAASLLSHIPTRQDPQT